MSILTNIDKKLQWRISRWRRMYEIEGMKNNRNKSANCHPLEHNDLLIIQNINGKDKRLSLSTVNNFWMDNWVNSFISKCFFIDCCSTLTTQTHPYPSIFIFLWSKSDTSLSQGNLNINNEKLIKNKIARYTSYSVRW